MSRQSFERLKTIAGDALDAVPPVPGRPPFPTALRQRQTDANGKRTTATHQHVRDHPSLRARLPERDGRHRLRAVPDDDGARAPHDHTVPCAWCTLGLAPTATPSVATLLANATALWFALDDTLYTTRFPKGDAVVAEVWTTAHPEPWSTDSADASWLATLANGLSLSGAKDKAARATKAAQVRVDTRVGRIFLKSATEWTDATAECAVDEVDDHQATGGKDGGIGKCVHVAYSPQWSADARREVTERQGGELAGVGEVSGGGSEGRV